MAESSYTEDLAEFGPRERRIASELLAKKLPENWYDKGTKLALNKNSGFVFLVNEEYQCAMINSDTDNLEIYHTTPHEGHEGFLIDLINEYKPEELHEDDVEYIRYMAECEDIELPKSWSV
jgi:hypothetical protein